MPEESSHLAGPFTPVSSTVLAQGDDPLGCSEKCWPVVTREQLRPVDVPEAMLSVEVAEATTEEEALRKFRDFLDGCRF